MFIRCSLVVAPTATSLDVQPMLMCGRTLRPVEMQTDTDVDVIGSGRTVWYSVTDSGRMAWYSPMTHGRNAWYGATESDRNVCYGLRRKAITLSGTVTR